ncbi:MAG: hypothetical protein V8Q93_08235 [Blautia faecis]
MGGVIIVNLAGLRFVGIGGAIPGIKAVVINGILFGISKPRCRYTGE